MRTRTFLWLASISLCTPLFLLAPCFVSADDMYLDTRSLNGTNSPVFLQNCRVHNRGLGDFDLYTTDLNRTNHDVLSAETELKIYNRHGILIGDQIASVSLDNPLLPNDVRMFKPQVKVISLSEPQTAISYATCKIIQASFVGQREWNAGQIWSEPLVPLPAKPHQIPVVPGSPLLVQPDGDAGTPIPANLSPTQ